MKLIFSDYARIDYLWWQLPGNESGLGKVNDLIKETERSPSQAIRRSEPLRGDLAGWWSRRITGEHRFVYRVSGTGEAQAIEIAQLRYFY